MYLPRKFKIGVAWPGDNCVDVFSNDVALVPTLGEPGDVADGDGPVVTGYMVYIGGGMGMAWAREDDTYPRLASPLGWVTPDRVVDAVEAVVTTQRDHGNRDDRNRARLKYLVDERGSEWIRAEVERRLGAPIGDPVAIAPWTVDHHHGTRDGVVGAAGAVGQASPTTTACSCAGRSASSSATAR